MQETDQERPAIGPSRMGLEMTEDVGARVTAILSDDKNGDHDSDYTDNGPEDSNGLEAGGVSDARRRIGSAPRRA